MPDEVKTEPKLDASSSSEFTRRRVTTSLGLSSIHVLIPERKASRLPPSRRVQVVWQSSRVPFELWTWAWRNRMPAESATVAL